jgi:DNA topoisomerase-3
MGLFDEGWEDAEKYKDELPEGWYDGDRKEIAVPESVEYIGKCPVCGANVVERDKGFFCEDMECGFGLWRDNRFFKAISKEITKEIAEDLLNCGTVKLPRCRSVRTGNYFDCYLDLTIDEEQRPHFEIRFPERKKRREQDYYGEANGYAG